MSFDNDILYMAHGNQIKPGQQFLQGCFIYIKMRNIVFGAVFNLDYCVFIDLGISCILEAPGIL